MTPDDPRVNRTRSVSAVLFLTLVTLTAYFYFYLYRSLAQFEAAAESDAARQAARRARWSVTAGLFLQFLAVLFLLGGVASLFSDPGADQAFWAGLEQGRLDLPAGLLQADALSQVLTWAGWVVFWAPLFAFFARALQSEGEPVGVAGIAGVLVAFRIVAGLLGLVGLGGVASAVSSIDAILYLVLVGCCVAAANAVWAAHARRGTA